MQWNTEQVDFLTKYYPKYGGIFCAEKLGVKRRQVATKTYFLKLKRDACLDSKVCTKCKLEKPLSAFGETNSQKKSKSGLNPVCLKCNAWISKLRKINNPEICQKQWRQANKRSYIKYKQYHIERGRKYKALKYKNDSSFRIKECVRSRILNSLNGKDKSKNTIKLLGCSIPELKSHLESKFRPNMNWDNRKDWHIDHIKPCSSFNLSDANQQRECFHYTNLQPLWATTEIAIKHGDFNSIGNREKGNKCLTQQ